MNYDFMRLRISAEKKRLIPDSPRQGQNSVIESFKLFPLATSCPSRLLCSFEMSQKQRIVGALPQYCMHITGGC